MTNPTENLSTYFGNAVNSRLEFLSDALYLRNLGEETGERNELTNNFQSLRNQGASNSSIAPNSMLISHSRNIRSNGGGSFYQSNVQDLSRRYDHMFYQARSDMQPLDYSNNYRNSYTLNLQNKYYNSSMPESVKGGSKLRHFDLDLLKEKSAICSSTFGTSAKHVPSQKQGNVIQQHNNVESVCNTRNISLEVIRELQKSAGLFSNVYNDIFEAYSSEKNKMKNTEDQSELEKNIEPVKDHRTTEIENNRTGRDNEPDKDCSTENEINRIGREVITEILESVERNLNAGKDGNTRSRQIETGPVMQDRMKRLVPSSASSYSSYTLKSGPSSVPDIKKKTFCCSGCPWAFSTKSALAKHFSRKHKSSKTENKKVKKSSTVYASGTTFQCNKCMCCFSDRSELKVHALIHLKEKRLKCTVCGLSFKRRRDLDEHSLSHNKKPAMCEVCGKTFSQAGNMKIHLRIHTKEKPYSCQHCGKSYAQSGDLKTHIRVHTDERPYLCEYCGNLFHSLSHLARHSKVHTKEKPYTCQVCDHSFAHMHHLKKHYRIHTQEKPYSCEVCGKAFSRADYVKQHMRVHTKEKPYICRICGKGFSQGGSLKLHQRVHTRQGSLL